MIVIACEEHRFEANSGASFKGSQSSQIYCFCKDQSWHWRIYTHIQTGG